MRVTFGIPIFQSAYHLANLLALMSLLRARNEVDADLVVVDDGSDADVRDRVGELCEKHGAKLICNAENRGVPFSWNVLVAESRNEIVIIANDDILIEGGSVLVDMAETLAENDSLGIVTPRERQIDGRGVPGNANFTQQSPILHAWPSGSLFALKKSLWSQCLQPDGSVGFWESLVIYGEEWDLGFSLAKMGAYTLVLTHCEYLHFKGSSTGSVRARSYDKQRYFSMNLDQLQSSLRNGPEPSDVTASSRVLARLGLARRRELVSRPMLSRHALSLKHGDDRFVSDPHQIASDLVGGFSDEVSIFVGGARRRVRPIPVPR